MGALQVYLSVFTGETISQSFENTDSQYEISDQFFTEYLIFHFCSKYPHWNQIFYISPFSEILGTSFAMDIAFFQQNEIIPRVFRTYNALLLISSRISLRWWHYLSLMVHHITISKNRFSCLIDNSLNFILWEKFWKSPKILEF